MHPSPHRQNYSPTRQRRKALGRVVDFVGTTILWVLLTGFALQYFGVLGFFK